MELKHYMEVVRRLRNSPEILDTKIAHTMDSIKFFGNIARDTRSFKWVDVRDMHIKKLKWLYAIQDDEHSGGALFENSRVLYRENIVIVEELYLAALRHENGKILGEKDKIYDEYKQIKSLREQKKLPFLGWMKI